MHRAVGARGSRVSAGLGISLALGQTLADGPEGLAAISTFRSNNVPRRRRLLLSASFFLPVLVGALLSYLLLRRRPETWQYRRRSPPPARVVNG